MDVTTLGLILISQAPFMRDCQRGIFAAGVLGDILPRKRRPSDVVRQSPTVRCLLRL